MKKLTITLAILAALFAGVIAGYVAGKPETVAGAASTSGTGTTAKRYSAVINQTAGTSTWASMLNGDATDRFITGSGCLIVNPASTQQINNGSYALTMATSSVNSNVAGSGTATTTAPLFNLVMGTSTQGQLGGNINFFATVYIASSTGTNVAGSATAVPAPGSFVATSTLIWPSGTYINVVGGMVLGTASSGTSTGTCYVDALTL